jgi:hypothetical protein
LLRDIRMSCMICICIRGIGSRDVGSFDHHFVVERPISDGFASKELVHTSDGENVVSICLDFDSSLNLQPLPGPVIFRAPKLDGAARIAWLGSGRAWQRFPVIVHYVCRHSSCQGVDDDKAKNPGDYRTVGLEQPLQLSTNAKDSQLDC